MRSKINQKKQEGFTIIEVLIVLAIAGLIILIVFLAVPALQRNSRNTQRNNDVAAIGGALSEFINNNNGDNPGDATEFNDNVETNANLGFYEDADVNWQGNSGDNTSTNENVNTVDIYTDLKCDGNDPTTTDASSRSIVALYAVETGGAAQQQCKEL